MSTSISQVAPIPCARLVMGMKPGERVRLGRKAKGWSQRELGVLVGVSQQAIGQLEAGDYEGPDLLASIAPHLEADLEYLTTGAAPWPRWSPEAIAGIKLAVADSTSSPQVLRPVIRETGVAMEGSEFGDDKRPDHTGRTGELTFVGSVGAGPGVITYFKEPKQFRMRPSLAVMRVHGDSAYPVAYDGQFVVIDLKRKVHHNNLVVIETLDGKSHLKRWCEAADAPDGFVLASVNGGVNTPYIPMGKIRRDRIWPVVGVLFEEEPADGDNDGQ